MNRITKQRGKRDKDESMSDVDSITIDGLLRKLLVDEFL